jgi:cation-transporting ATPase E
LRAIAAADPSPNATMAALAAAPGLGEPTDAGWSVVDRRPFSSARKWSAVAFEGRGWYLLGAPEMLLPAGADGLLQRVADQAGQGRRVLLLAAAAAVPDADGAAGEISGLRPLALVVLEEAVRPDAAATVRYFTEQDVAVKIISGDNPATVAAVAGRAGVTVHGDPTDARTLPTDGSALAAALEAGTVFGRVSPHQKRAMVHALQAKGHVVAMTGDGVNDVLALKDADLGVAMGSGSPASRAVAEVVLLDGAFSSLPAVVGEGRRVIANVERVANLFLTKTVWAILLAVGVGFAGRRYPFLPRHLTLTAALASSIPGLFLALSPSSRRARPGFVRRVLRFVVVTGPIVAVTVVVVDVVCRQLHGELDTQLQTADLIALLGSSLAVLAVVMVPFTARRRLLWSAMVALAVVSVSWGPVQRFLDLGEPTPLGTVTAVAAVAAAGALLLALHRRGALAAESAEAPGGASPG